MDILQELEYRDMQRQAWREARPWLMPAVVSVVVTVALPVWWLRLLCALPVLALLTLGLYWSEFWRLRSWSNLEFAERIIAAWRAADD